MAKKHDRKKVGEIISKVRELELNYKEGAKKFGIKPWLLYDYNRKANRDARAAVAEATAAEPAAAEAPKGTAASPVSLPGDVGELILSYRREHPSQASSGSRTCCPSQKLHPGKVPANRTQVELDGERDNGHKEA